MSAACACCPRVESPGRLTSVAAGQGRGQGEAGTDAGEAWTPELLLPGRDGRASTQSCAAGAWPRCAGRWASTIAAPAAFRSHATLSHGDRRPRPARSRSRGQPSSMAPRTCSLAAPDGPAENGAASAGSPRTLLLIEEAPGCRSVAAARRKKPTGTSAEGIDKSFPRPGSPAPRPERHYWSDARS